METEPATCAGPHLDVRKPKLKLPPNAADCHCHVFGPRDKYPWAANRLYTPPPVLLDDYLAMLAATGFERGVMVQTGLYGSDNRFIVDAIKAHPEQLRAIALIGEDITDRALRDLADGGVRGFRVNRTAKTGLSFDVARRLAERVKDFGWHVQFLLDIEDHPDIDTLARQFPDRGGDRSHGPARSAPRRQCAGLPGADPPAQVGPRLGQAVGAVPHLAAGAALRRHHAVRACAGRGRARPPGVGLGLAARAAGDDDAERRRSGRSDRGLGAGRSGRASASW